MNNLELLKKNLSTYFSINKKLIQLVKDTRKLAKKGITAEYQIGLKLNINNFNNVKRKLNKLINSNHKCRINKNIFSCKVNDKWEKFGQKDGNYGALYPDQFEGNKVYLINHAVQEQLLLEPSIFSKEMILEFLNNIGNNHQLEEKNQIGGKKKSGKNKARTFVFKSKSGKKTKMKKKNKGENIDKEKSVDKDSICGKYKDKSVRGTKKNWAYKKCMSKSSNIVENCKKLPPQGYNMYKYFCD